MQLTINLNKTVEQNAELYYTKAKKCKKKLEGIAKAVALAEQKKLQVTEKHLEQKQKQEQQKQNTPQQKREWYEKFRWFFSSEGFLAIGGRDATTNEVIIKKYTDKDDIVFHTDMAGSPFFVIKTDGKQSGKKTLQETADATAIYSRAWKKGLSTLEVFHVTPEQVSKTANTGEYMAKGAFMIRGKTTYLHPEMSFAVGYDEQLKKIIAGPLAAVKSHAKKVIEIIQGDEKASDVAKKIRKALNYGDIDTIIALLPPGECAVKK